MIPLGKVVNVTRRGQAVARGGTQVRIGMWATDHRGREVGRVQDLIGPVQQPYILIACGRGNDPRRLLGQELFTR